MKGGAFKLNMHPTDYFDENPYRGDRPLPPAKKQSDHKIDVKPFKPSSPGKNVTIIIMCYAANCLLGNDLWATSGNSQV